MSELVDHTETRSGKVVNNANEANCIRGNPVYSIICDPSYDDVVDMASILENKLEEMKSRFPRNQAVENLLNIYYKHTFNEMDKLSTVIITPVAEQRGISEHYNFQRKRFIINANKKLKKIEGTSKSKFIECRDENVDYNDYRVSEVMTDWYDKHEAYPYPTEKDVRAFSEHGNISTKSVEAWFSYERLRRLNLR